MKRLTQASLLFFTATLCASAGSIPINIEFTQPVFEVTPGEVVDVTAILQNTDPADVVYLNGDNLSVPVSSGSTDFFFQRSHLAESVSVNFHHGTVHVRGVSERRVGNLYGRLRSVRRSGDRQPVELRLDWLADLFSRSNS